MTRFTTPLPAVHHVGMVVRDALATARAFGELGGFAVSDPHDFEITDVVVRGRDGAPFAARYVFVEASPIAIEFIEPRGPGSVYAEFLADRGEGVHHIAFPVDDLDDRLADLDATGQHDRVALRARVPGLNRFAYVDGVPGTPLVELVGAAR
jgi:methylmalonyl-CoA/ethylmalonyl-CoA epimerase